MLHLQTNLRHNSILWKRFSHKWKWRLSVWLSTEKHTLRGRLGWRCQVRSRCSCNWESLSKLYSSACSNEILIHVWRYDCCMAALAPLYRRRKNVSTLEVFEVKRVESERLSNLKPLDFDDFTLFIRMLLYYSLYQGKLKVITHSHFGIHLL